MIPFRHPASLLRRSEPLRTALIAAAFWTLAVIALTNLRYVHLGGMPQIEAIVARATMVCCILLLGLVGARCVMAWRKSGSLAPLRRTLGGTPGMLLFGAVASYLAIGASVLGVEVIRGPGYGREPAVSRPPRRPARGRRGRRPRGAGGNRGRAVVAGRACHPDCGLRHHSRFAGPARSRHPAALQDSLSPDRRFRRSQRGQPGRLHDGSVGRGVAIQRRAAHARLAGLGCRRRRKPGDGVPNGAGRTRCAGGRVPVDQRPRQTEDLRPCLGRHGIGRDGGIRRCRGFLRRFWRVVEVAVDSRRCA